MSAVNWHKVQELQSKSYHGTPLTPEELKICELAIEVDGDRYQKQSRELRHDYAASFRMGK